MVREVMTIAVEGAPLIMIWVIGFFLVWGHVQNAVNILSRKAKR